MKKIFLILLLITCYSAANSQSRWSIGAEMGAGANISEFSGGMSDANALFTNPVHPIGLIAVYARYKIHERWSFQTGFNFSQIGFTYMLAQDYSLLKPYEHYGILETGTCISRIPVLIVYNSKLNCRNTRLIIGAGFTLQGIDNNWKSETFNEIKGEEMNNSKVTEMSEETHALSTASGSFAWLIGAEKVFGKGSMLRFTFEGNHGFSPVATSTVRYVANDQNYEHTFTNYASFFSFGVSYFFKPIGSKKAAAVEKL
jgi:hypothetical protein